MRRVTAILFDLDDTLVDRTGSIRAFLAGQHARYQAAMPDVSCEVYGDRFLALDGGGTMEKRLLYETLIRELAIAVPAAELAADFRGRFGTEAMLFPDTERVLRVLRDDGYKLGIVSNGSVRLQGGKIEHLGLAALVDTILISEREGLRKPDPAIFRRAADRLGVLPADCLFVGDNPEADIAGALADGMQAVWRRGSLPWPEHLARPSLVIETLAELPTMLRGEPRSV